MKKLILILLCLPMMTLAQQTYVPDSAFEAVLESILVGNGIANDDSVSTNAIRTVTQLNLVGLGIFDLTGIEYFDSLQILECSDNHLTTLDINSNTVLTYLDCKNNQLISLDVNTALTYLNCNNNQLITLDVSMNTALIYLHCDSNNIISLDISNNLVLSNLRCGYNQLANLDVNSDTALIQLWCNNNQLTSLNVSNNLALTVLRCNHNQLMSLDVSNNTNLIALRTHNNQCTSLNVNGLTSLSALWCQNNQLNSLDVSSNTALISLRLFNNQLINLDITNNTALTSLNCYYNQLNSLNLQNGNNINFSALNVTYNPNLYCIDVDDSTWSANNWANIDTQHFFSNNCNPISGCIDTLACNYDTLADTDDGSCIYSTTSNDTIVSNISISWNGMILITSGDYSFTLTNSLGCDSIANLNLTITTTGIVNLFDKKNKKIFKIINALGVPTKPKQNTPLFYIYDNGTVEKKIIIE